MSITVSLNNVTNLTDTVTAQNVINNNSSSITEGFTSALNIVGDSMDGTLDMDSNHIINLPSPSSANEPVRLGDIQSGTSVSVALPHLTGVVTSTAGVGTVVTVFSGTGNLPVTQLSSGVGASNSTFWRGDGTWSSVAAVGITAGAGIVVVSSGTTNTISVTSSIPIAVTSDTNVLGTLAGNALTLAWTSTLPLARGGAANALVASAGGQVFSNATGLAISTGATTANQIWLSAVTGTPVLSTSIWPVDCVTSQVLVCKTNSTWSASQTVSNLTLTTPTLTTATMTGTTALQNATMSGNLTFTGTGIGIVGSVIGDSATAGNVGELISTSLAAVSAIALSTGNASVIVSISLTPGDWDISSNACFSNTSASLPIWQSSFNTTASANPVAGAFMQVPYAATATSTSAFWLGPFRTSLSATATYSLVSQAVSFTGGSVLGWGSIRARRIR